MTIVKVRASAIAIARLQPHIPNICLSRPNALATIMQIQLIHVCSLASRSTCLIERLIADGLAGSALSDRIINTTERGVFGTG
jgi:hypothetical protein